MGQAHRDGVGLSKRPRDSGAYSWDSRRSQAAVLPVPASDRTSAEAIAKSSEGSMTSGS